MSISERLFVVFFTSAASLQAYAQQAAPTSIEQAFVAIATNACQPNETRPHCFVRYTLQKITPAPAGAAPYRFINPNLHCPGGYDPLKSFDNKLQDAANPHDNIYYYDAVTIFPVSQAQLDQVRAAGSFACTPSGGVVARHDTATEGGCDSGFAAVMNVNGSMAQRSTARTWRQDTYNAGSNKCRHYSLAGCPAWCSRWSWATYEYTNLRCTRAAGPYLATSWKGQVPGALYAPSVVLCDSQRYNRSRTQ